MRATAGHAHRRRSWSLALARATAPPWALAMVRTLPRAALCRRVAERRSSTRSRHGESTPSVRPRADRARLRRVPTQQRARDDGPGASALPLSTRSSDCERSRGPSGRRAELRASGETARSAVPAPSISSRRRSFRSPGSWPRVRPTRRLPRGCSSARARSITTCARCSPNSASSRSELIRSNLEGDVQRRVTSPVPARV